MDKLFNNKYRIKSSRMPNWDYGSNGKYFVTICTENHKHFFGNIKDESMILTEIGEYAWICWKEIPDHHPFVELEAFIIMPNHIHGIIIISKNEHESQKPNIFSPQSKNLGAAIRDFKSAVTRYARKQSIEFHWLPRYHDHIIRNNKEMNRIRNYIKNNPSQWGK